MGGDGDDGLRSRQRHKDPVHGGGIGARDSSGQPRGALNSWARLCRDLAHAGWPDGSDHGWPRVWGEADSALLSVPGGSIILSAPFAQRELRYLVEYCAAYRGGRCEMSVTGEVRPHFGIGPELVRVKFQIPR